ncbi:MAG: type VI secretion system tip protein TssI/VgrG [Planctomycetota bacterium]
MSLSQKLRPVQVESPFGADELLFYRMTAKEELGRPFEIELELLSSNHQLDLLDALGKPMTVTMEVSGGGSRVFSGWVNRFTQAGTQGTLAKYHATLVPWLWFLTRSADCRIFQEKSIPEIIQEVFRDHGFTDFKSSLGEKYTKREYCVQYRETDFDFVSRLMEQEGIYYFFEYAKGKHTLVLADGYSAHKAAKGYDKLPYYPPSNLDRREREHVYEWSISQSVQTGAYSLSDFDFERPKADLVATSKVSRKHSHANMEVFDYPGEYLQTSDGEKYARKRIESHQSKHERAEGSAFAFGMSAGNLFKLDGFPRSDQNREYLLVSTTLEVQNNEYVSGESDNDTTWNCEFTSIESKQPFRSEMLTSQPIVQGPQTAVVVGKKGEEIWTDKYGRVKVQFHWDRLGKKDENSSCWVRVAQMWAGKKWGSIHIPRIGQEVIVEFLEGDPDRPIVTGRVYNADEMPPYDLPANQTQSGIKSQSTKKANNKNFNELRFEDKKDAEQVYFHAERDFERVVENNDVQKIGFDKQEDGDQTIEVHNNQKIVIGNKDSKDGSQTIEIYKDRDETIAEGDVTTTIKKGKRTTKVKGNDALTIESGNQTIKVSSGSQSITAAQSITLKVGSSSIKIEPAAITLKSAQIKIVADAKIDMKAPLADCNASGVLTLKGGLTKIN